MAMDSTNEATKEPTKEPSKEATAQVADARRGSIGQFALKTAIVSGAIIITGWIMLELLDGFATRRMEQLESTIRSATAIGGHRFWTKLETELDRMAGPEMDLPAAKKQKFLAQIKTISDRWRPFMAEAAASIAGEAGQPAKETGQPAKP
jgi:hypothetical protein